MEFSFNSVYYLYNYYIVTNFIWPYLHQFFNDSHGLNGYGKPSKRPFDQCQSHLKVILAKISGRSTGNYYGTVY